MHVSLDSALGRQRRLNSVGESVLQIAPSAAAAYSLRSLTGGDPKVVRVRRSSDNTERDFNASGINSGALENFCDEATPARNRTGGAKYSTFSTDGVTGFSAVCSAAAACGYDIFGASSTAVQVSFDVVLNSGSVSVQLRPEFETGSAVSNSVIIDSSGSKSFTLTSTAEFKALLFISGATNFVVSNFSVNVPYNHSAFVETWYDQSGNSNDVTQATAGSQPKIVNAGSLVTVGGRASFKFDGSSDFLERETYTQGSLSQPNTFFSVAKLDAYADENSKVYDGHVSTARNMLQLNTAGNGQFAHYAGTVAVTGEDADADRHLFTSLINGASSDLRIDGTSKTTANTASQGMTGIVIGANNIPTSNFWDGDIQEIIIYNSNQSSTITAVETNINSHYSIF